MPGHEPHIGDDKELKDLGARITEARREAGLLPESKPAPLSAGRGMQAGFELAAGVVIFAVIGVALDRWLDVKPLFMLLGLIVGFAAGMWNLYRASMGADSYSVGIRKKDE